MMTLTANANCSRKLPATINTWMSQIVRDTGLTAADAWAVADEEGATTHSRLRAALTDCQHLLYPLLPPERDHLYTLRQRSHNFQLVPDRTSVLKDKNFIMRMLCHYILILFTDILLNCLFLV